MRRESERQTAALAYAAPAGEPDVRAILAQPLPAGELGAFADAQRPALALMGARITSEGDAVLDGAPARRLDVTLRDGAAVQRYWITVRDGKGVFLSCGGRGGTAGCDRIAASLRLFDVVGAGPPTAPAEGPPRELSLGGWSFEVPSNWAPFTAVAVPGAVFLVRSEVIVGRLFPNASHTAAPFAGDVAAFDRVGDQEFAAAGVRTLAKRETSLLGARAIEVEADWPAARGGHRSLSVQAVSGGRALTLTCSGDPAAFEPVRAACARLVATLRPAGG
jgi:hypothetical protein